MVDLRLLVNIAEANSLTRGAAQSNLSLPAASLRIKSIEDSLGAKLLIRSSQGVTLTPVGQAFTLHARIVQRQLEHLRADLQEYAKGVKGRVRVFTNTTAINFLPNVLQKFLSSHPDVDVDLRERVSPEIVRAVSDGTADIGIVAGTVRTEGLKVLPFHSERLVLVTSAGHPLAAKERVAFKDTLAFEFVGLHEGSAMHSFLSPFAREVSRSWRIRTQVDGFESVCRMIEANVGIGVLPESAAQRYSSVSAIKIVPLSDEWATRSMQICVRDLDQLPTFARHLVDLLISDKDAEPLVNGPRPAEIGERASSARRARTRRTIRQ